MMHAGKVLAQGPPAELVAQRNAKNLEEAFIGYLEEAAEKSAVKSPAAEPAVVEAPAVQAHTQPGSFSPARVWAFTRREAIELRHDAVRLAFALGPILLMIVFGYGISLDVSIDLFRSGLRWDTGKP